MRRPSMRMDGFLIKNCSTNLFFIAVEKEAVYPGVK